jgi:hypothetical protein
MPLLWDALWSLLGGEQCHSNVQNTLSESDAQSPGDSLTQHNLFSLLGIYMYKKTNSTEI